MQSPGKRPALRDKFMVKSLLKAPDSGGLEVIKNNWVCSGMQNIWRACAGSVVEWTIELPRDRLKVYPND